MISNYIKEVRDYTVRANEISLSPQLGVTRWRWARHVSLNTLCLLHAWAAWLNVSDRAVENGGLVLVERVPAIQEPVNARRRPLTEITPALYNPMPLLSWRTRGEARALQIRR